MLRISTVRTVMTSIITAPRNSNVLSPFLSKWFNECFSLGMFPDCLKIAQVFPLHKSVDKSIPSNFRPVSSLPTIAKIFERLL